MNDILELLESLYWIAVFTPPIAVFYFLIYTLIRKGRFLPLVHAFFFAPVGFWIGADAGGGFNQSGGWGFGNFAALLIGVWAAFLGFLLGLAVGFFFSKRRKTAFAAAAFVAGSLLYLFLHQLTVPLLLDAEYRRIEKILVKGWQPNEIHYARKRLAKIRPRVEEFAISYPLEDLPPASIQTLYKLRIID